MPSVLKIDRGEAELSVELLLGGIFGGGAFCRLRTAWTLGSDSDDKTLLLLLVRGCGRKLVELCRISDAVARGWALVVCLSATEDEISSVSDPLAFVVSRVGIGAASTLKESATGTISAESTIEGTDEAKEVMGGGPGGGEVLGEGHGMSEPAAVVVVTEVGTVSVTTSVIFSIEQELELAWPGGTTTVFLFRVGEDWIVRSLVVLVEVVGEERIGCSFLVVGGTPTVVRS